MKKKVTIAVVALALVLCFAVGSTLAWLVDSTNEVKNTFTYGDINIDLWENDYDPETGTLDTSKKVTSEGDYKMVPGNSIPKNPTVTVESDSEACWLFVKVEKSSNFDSFMTYAIADGWTALPDVDGVYYREVAATSVDTDFAVLGAGSITSDEVTYSWNENEVFVLPTVTKADLKALDTDTDGNAKDSAEYPTLTFTAYAVQRDSNIATAAQAWEIAQGN